MLLAAVPRRRRVPRPETRSVVDEESSLGSRINNSVARVPFAFAVQAPPARSHLTRRRRKPRRGAMPRRFATARAVGSARPSSRRLVKAKLSTGENAQLSELKRRRSRANNSGPGCRSMELTNQALLGDRSRGPREDLTCPSSTYMGDELRLSSQSQRDKISHDTH